MIKSAFNIDGLTELIAKLSKFPVAIRTALRRSARKIGGQVAKAAKAKAPNRKETIKIGKELVRMYGASQALKKSIGVKVATTRKGAVNAIVGPKRGSEAKVFIAYYKPTKAKVAQRNVTITIKPSKYAHLVENGFTAKIWASNKRIRVSPKPFLRPALDSNSGQVSGITTDYLQVAIDDLIAKGKITPDMGSDT
jgi:HK97 gp10 family phage protein